MDNLCEGHTSGDNGILVGVEHEYSVQYGGSAVDIREMKGAIHGYDIVEDSATVDANFKERIAAIQRFFGSP